MKLHSLYLVLATGIVLSSASFADEDSTSGTNESHRTEKTLRSERHHGRDKDDHTIVIEEFKGRSHSDAQPFVESGSDTIQSEPQDRMQSAYRSWEAHCDQWKKELRALNGKKLRFASCGSPKRSVETLQSEKQYTYESKAIYKIEISGNN